MKFSIFKIINNQFIQLMLNVLYIQVETEYKPLSFQDENNFGYWR